MTDEALILLVGAGTILVIKFALAGISRFHRRSQINMELDKMFRWFWDGTPEDELYAWYKVRMILKQREGEMEQKKISLVDQKIMNLDKKEMHGNLSIDPSGELVGSEIDATFKH